MINIKLFKINQLLSIAANSLKTSSTLILLLIFVFLWFIIKPAIPTIPSIKEKFLVCNLYDTNTWHSDNLFLRHFKSILTPPRKISFEVAFDKSFGEVQFSCKTRLPVSKLYQANTLNLEFRSNQKIDININLRIKGGGVPFDYLTYNLKEDTDNLVFFLDQKNNPKINWLRGDFDEILFTAKNFNQNQELIIDIDNIYLH